MNRQLQIINFVRNILGCTCPEKVFRQIEDREVALSSSPHTRCITIGQRLLIYVWNVKETDGLKENLFAMLEAGGKQRDEQGLNRFRAVLAVDGNSQDIATKVQSYFARYAGKDDRIHLHVVSRAELEELELQDT